MLREHPYLKLAMIRIVQLVPEYESSSHSGAVFIICETREIRALLFVNGKLHFSPCYAGYEFAKYLVKMIDLTKNYVL